MLCIHVSSHVFDKSLEMAYSFGTLGEKRLINLY